MIWVTTGIQQYWATHKTPEVLPRNFTGMRVFKRIYLFKKSHVYIPFGKRFEDHNSE